MLPKPLSFAIYALVCLVGMLVVLVEQSFMSDGQERILVWEASECRLGGTEIGRDNGVVRAFALCPGRKPVEIGIGARELVNSMIDLAAETPADTASKRFYCFQEHLVWSDRDEITCSNLTYADNIARRHADD